MSLLLRFALSLVCCCAAAAVWAEDPPLHDRVDALIDAAAVGPIAPAASDADFLRRVSLDLTGVIPSAEQARAFLADASPDKRVRLIDQLLASPQYARRMALAFDVTFMERRGEKNVKAVEWQAWLVKSFAENKPLDQLCRELIGTDGSDDAVRPAAKFLLDRDCEPNLVTRDAGRIFFGMDLQCAQCHDHPNINDYAQEDYYGLSAFFLRTSAFNEAAKKRMLVAEKADGEASFKSVFTGNAADKVPPRLPHGALAAPEPAFGKGEEYSVAPAKDVRGVPKHSRRAQLASLLAASPEFRRNLANRLWAHLFGRGLVHPLDGHFAANPPSHPELLALLADELASSKFDAKRMLRELALTRVYQRTCDAPAKDALNAAAAQEAIQQLAARRPELEKFATERGTALTAARASLKTTLEKFQKEQTTIKPLVGEAKTAQDAADKATAAAKTATEAFAKKQTQATAVTEASTKAAEAAKAIAEDQVLAQAAASIATRAQAINTELEAAKKMSDDLNAQSQAATQKLSTANEALAKAREGALTPEQLAEVERAALAAQPPAILAREQLAALDQRSKTAAVIVAYGEQAKADPGAAALAWQSLEERFTIAGQLAAVRPLNCEQFTLSLLQATGALDQRRQAAQAALEKTPPDALKNAPEPDRANVLAKLVEEQSFEQVRGNLNTFVALYATQSDADFQATVNQALFVENGSVVQSWIAPANGNLAERLTKIEDAGALSEELYLSILTRFPAPEEREQVASYLKDRTDRAAAVSELAWALLSSNEFRFNH